MSFSEQLRAARLAKGYTQQHIANLIGIDKSTYCGYETGKRRPRLDQLTRIAKALGVTVSDLVEEGYWATISQHEVSEAFSDNPNLTTNGNRNIIRIAGRDGSFEERALSDDQLSALKAILNQMPDASDDL